MRRASHDSRTKRKQQADSESADSSSTSEDDDATPENNPKIMCTKQGRIKQSYINKVLSPVIGYSDYELLHFVYDLNMWTSNLTSTDDCPLVHSVSYGWQGNLSQIQCKMDNVDVVDGNFAKPVFFHKN